MPITNSGRRSRAARRGWRKRARVKPEKGRGRERGYGASRSTEQHKDLAARGENKSRSQ